MHTQTEENYLKALFNLSFEKGVVTVQELSKELQIKYKTKQNPKRLKKQP